MIEGTSFLSGAGAVIALVVASVLTMPVSLGLLWAYQRAVSAAMRRPSGISEAAGAEAPELASAVAPPGLLVIEVGRTATRWAREANGRPLQQRAVRGPWISAGIYAFAGVVYAVFLGWVWLAAGGNVVHPLPLLLHAWTNLWPLVLTIGLVVPPGQRALAVGVVLYLVGLLICTLLSVQFGADWRDVPIAFLVRAGPPAGILLLLLHPRVRAVGPLVFAFWAVTVGGGLMFHELVLGGAILRQVAALTDILGISEWFVVVLVTVVGLGLSGVIGRAVLSWVGRQYTLKRFSDQSLLVDSVWLIASISTALKLSVVSGLGVALALGSFVLYRLLTELGCRLAHRERATTRPGRVLWLRVFGSRGRSEDLWKRVGARWRYTGSIQLIAGTDLVSTTVEPHQFLEFADGRLAQRYITDRAALDQRLRTFDVLSDVDGRFRVNECFCHDDTWRMTLSRLVKTSDAVLMDLRAFSPANQGCVFELQELVHLLPLDCAVFVVDQTTDVPYLQSVLREAWSSMSSASPNRSADQVSVVLCDVSEGVGDGLVVLARLADAVVSSRARASNHPAVAQGEPAAAGPPRQPTA